MNDDSAYKSVLLYDRGARGLFYACDPLLQVRREDNLLDDPHVIEVEEPEDETLSAPGQYRRMIETKIRETVQRGIAQGAVETDSVRAQIPVLQEIREVARKLTLDEALKEASSEETLKFLYASRAAFEKLASPDAIQDEVPRYAEYNRVVDLIENEYLNEDEMFLLDLKDFRLSQSLLDFSRKNEVVRFVWRGKLECTAPEKQALVTF